jgi:hypothetical protein
MKFSLIPSRCKRRSQRCTRCFIRSSSTSCAVPRVDHGYWYLYWVGGSFILGSYRVFLHYVVSQSVYIGTATPPPLLTLNTELLPELYSCSETENEVRSRSTCQPHLRNRRSLYRFVFGFCWVFFFSSLTRHLLVFTTLFLELL